MTTTLSHSDLNQHQLAQVAYLFADHFFVTDPGAYQYELNKNGDVTGRCIVSPRKHGKARSVAPLNLSTQQEVNLTDEIIRRARMNMDALAASVAQQIHQHQCQLEEAHHE